MDLNTVQSFLGWCLVVNLGIYLWWVVIMFAARDWLVRKHSRWFGLEPERLPLVLYQFLGLFKLLLIVFNFTPWIALMIVNRG